MLKGLIINITAPLSATEASYVTDFLRHAESSGLKFPLVSIGASVLSPNTLSQAIKGAELRPEECLIITDTDVVADAATAVDIPCIGLLNPNAKNQNLSRAYALLESFESPDIGYLYRTHAHALSYPADILETERLIIREFSENDFPALYTMCRAPETVAFMEETPKGFDTEQEKHRSYLSNIYPVFDLALWGVFTKDTGILIGRAGFSLPEDNEEHFSLGYLIDVPYRKKGYAKECVPALLSYAKALGYSKITVRIKQENIASLHVLKNCGFPYRLTKEASGIRTYLIELT